MIKVLVVDDDKLVRKGLISMMPWQEFDMKVVGEASNGEKALQFLESHSVDLVLTDLGMPVMSGIELMRVLRKRYSELHVVVLTVHQDFEYVQEALRLGAIDYISKVDLDLEKEQLEDMLGRIADRIQGQARQGIVHQDGALEQGYSVVVLDHKDLKDWAEELKYIPDIKVVEVDRNNWLVLALNGNERDLFDELSKRIRLLQNVVLIQLSDLQQFTLTQVQRWVRSFTEKELFYEYNPDNTILSVCINKNYDDLYEQNRGVGDQLEEPKELLLSGEWLYDDVLFQRLLIQLKMLRIPQTRLIGLLYSFVNEWNRAFAGTVFGKIKLDETLHSWFQIERWLEDTRTMIRYTALQTNYSPEIVNCVLKAEKKVRMRLDQPLTSAEVAKEMNMSRSYFSQCFKDIIGRTFKDYVRELRMEKAKQYLVHTNNTIQWIAEHTGYTDEKYFSRTFRDLTGLLPSEYRVRKRIPQ
ncbi:response regulator [Paenibacillus sp. RS8]|uniref:response regulator transcription factor n=1 Tax=Paenibacillus sp. RS8 TaxID=3242681 RepID=UPI0035BFB218